MSSRHALFLDFDIKAQPDDITCGPTCLHALYQYYNDTIALKEVINEVKSLKTGGTLAVMLGNHALQRGYDAHIYTYNLTIFDPSWSSLSSRKMQKICGNKCATSFEANDCRWHQKHTSSFWRPEEKFFSRNWMRLY